MPSATPSCLQAIFEDQRLLVGLLTVWTVLSSAVCYYIMYVDNSSFLSFGPNPRTALFGVQLDSWFKWWVVAIYTFVSTTIAAFASDSIVPWVTNTIQDHKTKYIPYPPWVCIMIIQLFTIYAVIMSVIGLFVALSQVDFMLIRLIADILVNHITTLYFVRDKVVDPARYREWQDGSELTSLCKTETSEKTANVEVAT